MSQKKCSQKGLDDCFRDIISMNCGTHSLPAVRNAEFPANSPQFGLDTKQTTRWQATFTHIFPRNFKLGKLKNSVIKSKFPLIFPNLEKLNVKNVCIFSLFTRLLSLFPLNLTHIPLWIRLLINGPRVRVPESAPKKRDPFAGRIFCVHGFFGDENPFARREEETLLARGFRRRGAHPTRARNVCLQKHFVAVAHESHRLDVAALPRRSPWKCTNKSLNRIFDLGSYFHMLPNLFM